jgi:putative DNA primase/helicase
MNINGSIHAKFRSTQVVFNADALRLGLAPIAGQGQFCTWRLEPNPDKPEKPRKVPYVRGGWKLTGSYSDPALPAKLMTLEEAIAACEGLGHDGIGVVFTPQCGIVGLDLDDCVDAETGKPALSPLQRKAAAPFKTVAFAELSQSGRGLHLIALGKAETLKANGSVELFGDRNFLALTGNGKGVSSEITADAVACVVEVVREAKAAMKPQATAEVLPFKGATGRASGINAEVLSKIPEPPDPERAASALAAITSPSDYDDWRNLVWAFSAAGGDVEVMIAHSYPGSETRLREIWKDYDPTRQGGIGPGTLYKQARDAGWTPPTKVEPVESDVPDGEADALDAQATDLWMSKQIVKLFKREFLYDHSVKAWRKWRAGSWGTCGRAEHIERVKALAAILMGEATRQLQADAASNSHSERTKKLMACAMRAQSATGIEAALRLAQSSPELAIGAEDFDRDPDLFNTPNGVIHLPSGELREHDPSLMVCRQSPIEYDLDATCPQFEKFMLEISCDDPDWVGYMQRVMGYALSGHVNEEKLFFWLGNGANGKSVLGNLFRHVLGSYGGVAPAAFLMLKRSGDSNGPTPDIANLAGRRMVAANEVEEGSCMSGQTLKTAVSTEAITARHLHSPPFTFLPTHKLFIRGNHRPIIKDNDEGIWRRIDLIPFDLNVPVEQRDQGLEARLMGEAPGILAWMVRGFQAWQREGLRPARRVRDASLAYRNESDILAQWVSDCCETGSEFQAIQKDAYTRYRMWCHDQGLRQYAKKSFTRGLKERGFTEGRQGGGARSETYKGFRLC